MNPLSSPSKRAAESPQGARGRTLSTRQAVEPKGTKSRGAQSVYIGSTDNVPRGYHIDYAKLKTLCHQAGLKIVDLYEPGVVPRQLISEGTLKKWRQGGRGTSDSLGKIADALSERLGWRVEWRELTQAGMASVSLNHRLAILPFENGTVERVAGDEAAGFRASILAQLSKLRGLRVVSVPALDWAATAAHTGDTDLAPDVVLSATLRTHNDLARLDVELTDAETREILWASSYPFSAAELLRAQTAIAADVANQVGRTLAPA